MNIFGSMASQAVESLYLLQQSSSMLMPSARIYPIEISCISILTSERFREETKQTVDGFLRSLLAQLACSTSDFPPELQDLHNQRESKNQ